MLERTSFLSSFYISKDLAEVDFLRLPSHIRLVLYTLWSKRKEYGFGFQLDTPIEKYNSVVPSEMTDKGLISIIGHLHTITKWGLTSLNVELPHGNEYAVDASKILDYREELRLRGA